MNYPPIETLRAVLGALHASPLSDRIRIFGSVKSGSERPHDIDCAVDLDTPAWAGGAGSEPWVDIQAARPECAAAIDELLAIVRSPATRDALDLFVRVEGVLFYPNAGGTWWLPHPNANAVWRAICERGIPLSDVRSIPHQPPQPEQGGRRR